MVSDFDAARRTPWGVRFITGPNGLSTTSREASVFRTGWKKRRDVVVGVLPVAPVG
jgi:hypothetical protein